MAGLFAPTMSTSTAGQRRHRHADARCCGRWTGWLPRGADRRPGALGGRPGARGRGRARPSVVTWPRSRSWVSTEEDRARFAEDAGVREGDPAVQDRIGLDGRVIERDLRERGHAEARVRPRVKPVADDRPRDRGALRGGSRPFVPNPGGPLRGSEGLAARSGSSKVAGLESWPAVPSPRRGRGPGAAVPDGRVPADPDLVRHGSPEPDDAETRVTFELEEVASLATRLRWPLGGGERRQRRGRSAQPALAGRRAPDRRCASSTARDLKNLRLYHIIPRIVGEQSSLELFIEGNGSR